MGNQLRSPFFYVGDKYKLMPQIITYFPEKINRYYEPFTGGSSSALYVTANEFFLNDIDPYIIKLHKFISGFADCPDKLFDKIFRLIAKYELTLSYKNITVTDEYKRKYIKTYFAEYNRTAYLKIRQRFNLDKNNMYLLYILLIYGFNHFMRFNQAGKFNLPVGNVDFNQNVYNALIGYLEFSRNNDITFSNKDFSKFIDNVKFQNHDFVYLDPPYLISASEYNKIWSEEKEKKLIALLDKLNENSVKFAISNLTEHKGKKNEIFLKWASRYNIKEISSNYISYHDNTIKNSKEVLVRNYD
ncbi:hypothetical protein FACS1894188_05270 [Clostridia bacterium]|nr:hypothetical protein FACS1894188_05270 [Clostridia bacterium]